MPSDGAMTSAAAAELRGAYASAKIPPWGPAYEQRFLDLMRERRIEETLTPRCSTTAACSAAKTPAPPIPPFASPSSTCRNAGATWRWYIWRNGRVAMASRCRYAPAVWVSLRLHFGLPTRSADSNSRG